MTDTTDRRLSEAERRRLSELGNNRKLRQAVLRLEQQVVLLTARLAAHEALKKHQ